MTQVHPSRLNQSSVTRLFISPTEMSKTMWRATFKLDAWNTLVYHSDVKMTQPLTAAVSPRHSGLVHRYMGIFETSILEKNLHPHENAKAWAHSVRWRHGNHAVTRATNMLLPVKFTFRLLLHSNLDLFSPLLPGRKHKRNRILVNESCRVVWLSQHGSHYGSLCKQAVTAM